MQEHERLAVAVLLVVGVDVTELDVGGHRSTDRATRENSSDGRMSAAAPTSGAAASRTLRANRS